MNFGQDDQFEFLRILGALLNSSATPEDEGRLEGLLKERPDRIDLYLRITELEILLTSETTLCLESGKEVSLEATSDAVIEEGLKLVGVNQDLVKEETLRTSSSKAIRRGTTGLPHYPKYSRTAAALLVAATIAIGWWSSIREPAVTIFSVDNVVLRDVSSPPRIGQELVINRDVELSSGRLGLRTRLGVTLLAQGPAVLRPLQNGDFELDYGKMRVRVSPEAESFAVHCPDGKITDLGTEFGVDVDPSGKLRTEVYDGRVQLALTGEGNDEKPIEFQAGWGGIAESGPPRRLQSYEIASRNSRIKWWSPSQESATSTLALRPVYYHRFDHPVGSHAKSSVNPRLYSAQLKGGARFAVAGPLSSMEDSGRALHLRRGGFAEIPIGFAGVEQTGEYTFSLWIQTSKVVDQSIFATSNHLGPDQRVGPQLRVRSDGTVEHHLFSPGSQWGGNPPRQVQSSLEPVSLDSWRHVVVSASTAGQMMLYLDGLPIADPMQVDSRITGAYPRLLLGSGSQKLEFASFEGLIDELSFFTRQLTPQEVLSLYQASRDCFGELR